MEQGDYIQLDNQDIGNFETSDLLRKGGSGFQIETLYIAVVDGRDSLNKYQMDGL